MSPEKAKVFVVEDDKRWQRSLKLVLESEGHSIVLTATNLQEALDSVSKLEEFGVQVAILDGNLDEYSHSGADGLAVLRAIREAVPEVKTIGMSGKKMEGVDIDVGKLNCIDVGKVVTGL